MTNSDRLQEIRERAEKATPGPWQHIEAGDHFGNAEMWNAYSAWCNEHFKEEMWWERTPPSGVVIQGVWHIDSTAGYAIPALDEEFIVASREDIPYLLQLVTEQQNEISWLRTWIFRLHDPETAAQKILKLTEEPMTIEQIRDYLGIEATGYRKQERPI